MNQYFDYNPITGLNYYSGEPNLLIDLKAIPNDIENKHFLEKWLFHVRQMGISMIDTGVQKIPIETIPRIIANI